jgi:hypothetical protein
MAKGKDGKGKSFGKSGGGKDGLKGVVESPMAPAQMARGGKMTGGKKGY